MGLPLVVVLGSGAVCSSRGYLDENKIMNSFILPGLVCM